MSIERTVSFGYWLRRRRKALDLTQEELARRVGCTAATIKKIETDARRPSRQLAELLANELHISPQDRVNFIRAARAERSPEQLSLSDPLAAGAPPHIELPAFLTASAREPALEATRFVARTRELAAHDALLDTALGGSGQVAFIAGEAGRGKTALMAEFARRAQSAHPTLIVASGNCTALSGLGDPYLPFRDVLSMLSGDVQARWVAGAITQEHARRLWTLLPATVEALLEHGRDLLDIFVPADPLLRRVTSVVPQNARLLGELRVLADRNRERSRDLRQAALFDQYSRVLRALAEQYPLLLLLDDLQWADDASINLLFHIGRRLEHSRVMIVGAYRDSQVALGRPRTESGTAQTHPLLPLIHEFTRSFGNTPFDLDETTPSEGREFVGTLLDAEPNQLAESFRSSLFERTQGHPLFTVELLRDLKARGDLVRDEDGRWVQTAALDWNKLPVRIEAIIAQRLERLDKDLWEILSIASVQGEGFSAQVLALVSQRDEWTILRWLSQELRHRHHLVRDRDEILVGEQRLARYWFSHVLFQQYLYSRLSLGERRILHEKVANALEMLHRGGLDEITAQLAHHYAEAGQPDRAVNYSLQAGDRARTLYAHQEALEHYQRALRFLKEMGDEERASRTLMKLGLTYNIAFDFERARLAYEEGFTIWQRVEAMRPVHVPASGSRTLRLNWRDPDTLDPALPLTIWTVSMIGQFFSGLVRLTPEMDVAPDMARSWHELDGGLTYIFHLREDAYWSDGTPVTASDFEYSWKRILHPATQAAFPALLLHDIRGARAFHQGANTDADSIGVRALDDKTLLVELEVPVPYFIQLLAFPTTYPVPRWTIETHGGEWTEPGNIVSNGPYRLVAWEHNQKMVLERSANYHGAWGNVHRVELCLDADPDRVMAQYESDELDLLNLWFLPPAAMDLARQRHMEEYLSGPQLLTYYFTFDVTRPPFDDLRVRRALNLALDKQALANIDLRGNFFPATGGFVPPGMPGHVPGIGPHTDVKEARALLAEAGYSFGSPNRQGRAFPEIEILTRLGRAHLCEPVIQQWRERLGIRFTVQELGTPELEDRMRAEPPHVFLHLWVADYPDPDCYLRVCVQDDQKLFGWYNADYDELIEQARRIPDQPKRMELYRKAEQILIEEMPMLLLTYGRVHVLLKPWLKNYRMARMKQQFWHELVLEDN